MISLSPVNPFRIFAANAHIFAISSRKMRCGAIVDSERFVFEKASRKIAGADDGIRTRDLRFTKPLLYQLSYVGVAAAAVGDRGRAAGTCHPPPRVQPA